MKRLLLHYYYIIAVLSFIIIASHATNEPLNHSMAQCYQSVSYKLYSLTVKSMLHFTPVIFNRGSAEPQGSANICHGFRRWPVKIT